MIEERTLSHEKTILVGVINSRQNIEQVKEYLDELEFLLLLLEEKYKNVLFKKLTLPIQKHLLDQERLRRL